MAAIQAISIVGATLVLGAFAALQFQRVRPLSVSYLVANVLGSASLATAAVLGRLWAFVVLNSVWGLVSLRSLARVLRRPHEEGPRAADRLAGRSASPRSDDV